MDPLTNVRPGAVLDDAYELLCPIGRGGMATVFEARALQSGRIVAVKLMRELDEDPSDARARFFREVSMAAALRHPGIVELLDFGVCGDVRYLVMARLRGRTLGQELRRYGPLVADRAVARILEVFDAVEVAHERGIVHSDLKPNNLFLRDAGGPAEAAVVLDLGVAHRVHARNTSRAGTPQYAPPELLLGHRTSPRTDVFQLGLVLAEMLAGQAVLRDVTTARETLQRLAAGPLPLPVPLRGSAFREVVQVAVSPHPQDRFATVAELREALLVAWLRQKGSPAVVIHGDVPDDAHTAPFDEGSLEAPADLDRGAGWVGWALLLLGVLGVILGAWARP